MDTILSNQTLYYRNNSRKRTALHVTDLNFPIPNGVAYERIYSDADLRLACVASVSVAMGFGSKKKTEERDLRCFSPAKNGALSHKEN